MSEKDRMRHLGTARVAWIFVCGLIVASLGWGQVADKTDDAAQAVTADEDLRRRAFDFDSDKQLRRFVTSLEGVRVVVLGEVHGDGGSYLAKARLIRFLHEHAGFDVLAWESAFLEMRALDRKIAAGAPATIYRTHPGLAALWRRSTVLEPLFEYIASTRKTERRLRLFGLDCKFGHMTSYPNAEGEPGEILRHHIHGFFSVLDEKAFPKDDLALLDKFSLRLHESEESEGGAQPIVELTGRLRKTINRHRAELERAHGAAEVSFTEQLLDNIVACDSWIFGREAEGAGPDDAMRSLNPRDEAMSRSLSWLHRQDPTAKIIIWTGGYHGFRHINKFSHTWNGNLDSADATKSYRGLVSLADHVDRTYGRAAYVINFTAASGTTGRPPHRLTNLLPPHPMSLEFRLDQRPFERALLNLRALPDDHVWSQPQWARPFSFQYTKVSWPRSTDALVQTRKTMPESVEGEGR